MVRDTDVVTVDVTIKHTNKNTKYQKYTMYPKHLIGHENIYKPLKTLQNLLTVGL